ncbi:hypothetical protein K7711_40795 [Nocardia sp. CA2R105]|uniref:hypothetical protein n=1 Tax=Nocardia coffeae TaxID=2873381 RepID=UPI001CA66CA4|nr:hypothetical protein [Nocardia coffeae]MBY8862866.1 hypothetical protein [Nocardia coffeae]
MIPIITYSYDVPQLLQICLMMIASLSIPLVTVVLFALFHAGLLAIVIWALFISTALWLFWAGTPNLMVDAVSQDHTGQRRRSELGLRPGDIGSVRTHRVGAGQRYGRNERRGPDLRDTGFVIIFIYGAT